MRNSDEEIPILVAQSGPLNGQRWFVRKTLIAGREANCDIVIPERQVSRQHVRLTPTSRGILLEDMGSKNGTHHNGRTLTESTLLQDGDVIQIAFVQQFLFLSSDATLPLTPEDAEQLFAQPGRLRLEKRSRRVWIGEQEVLPPLSVSQFQLLESLYTIPDNVVPRNNIILKIWGEDQAVLVSEQALDALVRRLRDRLSGYDPGHEYIVTVRGHGLRLDNPPA